MRKGKRGKRKEEGIKDRSATGQARRQFRRDVDSSVSRYISERMTLQGIEITPKMIEKGAKLLRAIDHKFRQQILKLLEKQGELTVTDLHIQLRAEQSIISQHLTILREAELVRFDKQGKFHYYKVHYTNLKILEAFLQKL